jgi:hypothetical protein
MCLHLHEARATVNPQQGASYTTKQPLQLRAKLQLGLETLTIS